jgi:hypothetical protein
MRPTSLEARRRGHYLSTYVSREHRKLPSEYAAMIEGRKQGTGATHHICRVHAIKLSSWAPQSSFQSTANLRANTGVVPTNLHKLKHKESARTTRQTSRLHTSNIQLTEESTSLSVAALNTRRPVPLIVAKITLCWFE